MAPILLKPELVKPMFDMNVQQLFLLRPMTGYERSIVNHWCFYYKNTIYGHRESPGSYRDDFILYLGTKGFRPKTLRSKSSNRDALLFQDLFKIMPKIDFLTALNRITGMNIKLHDEEIRDGFREFVFMFRDQNGDLPRRKDFVKASEERLFLPETGIILFHPLRLQNRETKREGKGESYGIAYFYEKFFEIPGEITLKEIESLRSASRYSLDDLINNLKNVQKSLENKPRNIPGELVATQVDIENYEKENPGAVPWGAYSSWLYHNSELVGSLPNDCVRSLDWLREQAGVSKAKVFTRRAVQNPRGYWTKQLIFDGFCEAWLAHNPSGYQPYNRKLLDPPRLSHIAAMCRIQADILNEYGMLDAEACFSRKVPMIQIPSVSTIRERYPGGYKQLLADVQDHHRLAGQIRYTSIRR